MFKYVIILRNIVIYFFEILIFKLIKNMILNIKFLMGF